MKRLLCVSLALLCRNVFYVVTLVADCASSNLPHTGSENKTWPVALLIIRGQEDKEQTKGMIKASYSLNTDKRQCESSERCLGWIFTTKTKSKMYSELDLPLYIAWVGCVVYLTTMILPGLERKKGVFNVQYIKNSHYIFNK